MSDNKNDQKLLAQIAKHFDKFYSSEVLSEILGNWQSICDLGGIQHGNFVNFYPELKPLIKSNQAASLFKLLDEKCKHPVYQENMQAANIQMTIVGAGPIGLRTAIEAQLLGARVTVLEKRSSFTRNNVLHLWPWVIEDLKSLGAKNFYPRFCTGTMNHISIWRLQCVLLKTALCFGVEIVEGVEFKALIEPQSEGEKWQLTVLPEGHPVGSRPVDVLIGAEGKHVSVPGFRRKEFRGKLAIAITANFKNKRTTAEAVVDEISGVAFVYKQDFFNNLYEEFGIALENIVYYKDDTHYFVMCTKKHSLLDRQVLREDLSDPMALLNPKNVNKDALLEYIRDACDYCTDYQLPHFEFAVNHRGEPDVALFDFTSMFASGNSCHVMEKKNSQLLLGLVGDGLLEPFWPTGTGIARGFLGAFDAVWLMRQWASGDLSPSEVMAERETIYKLLPQTTSENITKDFKNVTIVPSSRYPNLPRHLYKEVSHLYASDSPQNMDLVRHEHPAFKEVVTRRQLMREGPRTRMPRIQSAISPVIEPSKAQRMSDANADAFLQANRERRKSDLGPSVKRPQERNTLPARKPQNPKPSPTSKVPQSLKDRIEAKKALMRAENGEKGEHDKRSINDPARQAEFVKKMSKTFGYGMPSNAEDKPDMITEEAEKCALLVKSSKSRKRSKDEKAQVKRSQTLPSMERERLHSSVAPIVPDLDIDIDPELDFLLAQLEQDNDFSHLNENEQKTWLESLFFQDTTHLPGRTGKQNLVNPREQLNKRKSEPKPTLRVNSSNTKVAEVKEDVTAVHVNDKMKNLAVDFFKESENKTERKASIDQSCEEITGVNKNLCNLAQSYFQAPDKSTTTTNSEIHDKDEDIDDGEEKKANLVASFFNAQSGNKTAPKSSGNTRVQLKSVRNPQVKIPERVSFSPKDKEVTENEDDEIERLLRAAKHEFDEGKSLLPDVSPPAPPRRDENTKATAMMRCLNNISGIMAGKK